MSRDLQLCSNEVRLPTITGPGRTARGLMRPIEAT